MSSTLILPGTAVSAGINHTVPDIYLWTASLVRGTGAIMGITLVPSVPLQNVTAEGVQQVARKCAEINAMGVSVLLNFAPEMKYTLALSHTSNFT